MELSIFMHVRESTADFPNQISLAGPGMVFDVSFLFS